MRIRGERECSDCGKQWSYYETGSVACPACGSLHSRGIGERKQHTAAPVTLDLSPVRELAGNDRWTDATEEAIERCGEYLRRRGFVHAGDLLVLDDTYLAASELRAVARAYRRDDDGGDHAELYLLDLLGGADAEERPAPETVPNSDALRAARALAYAKAIREYGRDVRAYLSDHPDPTASTVLGSITGHVKRVQALDGDVDLRTVESLVSATREVGRAIAENDETVLATARSRLDRL